VRRVLSALIYALGAAAGLLAFATPFVPAVHAAGALQGERAALVTTALVALALLALLIDLQGQALNAKTVALLATLVAIASVLRFIDVAFPLPGGFSPVFVPIILGGYVFGARFGFLMGALTLLASALVTGVVGPWLPYQMFAAGWVGLTAAWLGGRRASATALSRGELALLVAFSAAWGFFYGAIMNLYFWPFLGGAAELSWQPGLSPAEILARYATFYAVTSLGWDALRALGNVVLTLLLAPATVRVLRRFRRRFDFEVVPHA